MQNGSQTFFRYTNYTRYDIQKTKTHRSVAFGYANMLFETSRFQFFLHRKTVVFLTPFPRKGGLVCKLKPPCGGLSQTESVSNPESISSFGATYHPFITAIIVYFIPNVKPSRAYPNLYSSPRGLFLLAHL